MLSIIIPAHDEALMIDRCLQALLNQAGAPADLDVIVAANACRDDTVERAKQFCNAFQKKGWTLSILDIAEPGKPNALNRGDAIGRHANRLYLDADVVCSPMVIAQIGKALEDDVPRYATGHLTIAPAQSWVTRRYASFWQNLPFMTDKAPGAGLFAVNAAARARWGTFPDIISDDTYVRLLFAPSERIEVCAPYLWPLVEGWANLIRVRRRQDAGVDQVMRRWPTLGRHATDSSMGAGRLFRLFAEQPVSFCVYGIIRVAARIGASRQGVQAWTRGR